MPDEEKEIWKDVEGYEGIYMVSSPAGRFAIIKKGFVNLDGYLKVNLRKTGKDKQVGIHQLLGQAFIERPPGTTIVHHKNRNRADNHVSNLEWVTPKKNRQYSVEAGTCKGFELHPTPVTQIDRNGNIVAHYESIRAAGRNTGIAETTISQVCRHTRRNKTAGGFIWRYSYELDDDTIDELRRNLQDIQWTTKEQTDWPSPNRRLVWHRNLRCVKQLSPRGHVVGKFLSIREASRYSGIGRMRIQRACKSGGTAGGFRWQYA